MTTFCNLKVSRLIAALPLLAFVVGTGIAQPECDAAYLLYRNTFDGGGNNVGLGTDPTAPASFFPSKVAGTAGNAGDPNSGVSSDTFVNPPFTNATGSSASGTHARFTTSVGNNLNYGNSAATVTSPFYQTLVASINELGPGSYDLTFAFDFTTNRNSSVDITLWGDTANNAGRFLAVNGNAITGVTADQFINVTRTVNFQLVESGANPGAGIFTVGQFQGLRVGIRTDNRTGTVVANARIDNLTITSTTIPEPGSLSILGAASVALLGWRRRRTH